MSGVKTNTHDGFTIVELLVVIVVIAVLAAISIVAFNGIQARARNAQTIQTATAWIKAIKMYEADKGEVVHLGYDSCLGENYPWDFEGTSSGSNQCRYTSFSYYTESKSTPLNNALSQYLGGKVPTPSMQTIGTSNTWARGITYVTPAVGGQFVLAVALADVSSCPAISGITANESTRTGGMYCFYPVGTRLR